MADRPFLRVLAAWVSLALCLACGGGGGTGPAALGGNASGAGDTAVADGGTAGTGIGTGIGGGDTVADGGTGGTGIGGGTDIGGGTVADGGTGGTGISFGPITNFGSIFVNGVEYEIDTDTAITLDGTTGHTHADLRRGAMVKVTYTTDDAGTPWATAVTFDDQVEGPIEAMDLAAGTLEVLGQTVIVDDLTIVEEGDEDDSGDDEEDDDLTLSDLAIGQVVEVSGQIDPAGVIHATRIERKAESATTTTALEVKGTLAGLDLTAETFTIGGLHVHFGEAVDRPATLANGLYVQVDGTQALPKQLDAVAVRVIARNPMTTAPGGSPAALEGYVLGMTSTSEFTVDGVPVRTSEGSRFIGGSAADLTMGTKVEVEGTLESDGTLLADAIAFRIPVKVQADVDPAGIDAAAGTVTLLGGMVWQVDRDTHLVDQRERVRPFTLADIEASDHLSIYGYWLGDTLHAVLLKRPKQVPASSLLQGPVDEADPVAGTFRILGATVSVTDTTKAEVDGTPVAGPQLLDALAQAATAQVTGAYDGGVLAAKKLSLQTVGWAPNGG